MTRLRDYQSWKSRKLGNPIFAAHYLSEIERSSPELLLTAIKNVVQAREVSAVAKEAGVARENIYRAFSEQGNPTMTTFREVLKAVGVKFIFGAIDESAPSPTRTQPAPLTFSAAGLTSGAQEFRGGLGSSDEALVEVRYASDTNQNPPKYRPQGIGQHRDGLRSAYGRH